MSLRAQVVLDEATEQASMRVISAGRKVLRVEAGEREAKMGPALGDDEVDRRSERE